MKRIKENIIKNFKDAFSTQAANANLYGSTDSAVETIMFKSDIPENEDIIKKTKRTGNMKNLVGKTKMKKPIGKLYSIGKSESKEATGSGSAGGYEQPLFTELTKREVEEKWSKKYKDSIDCNNPKGFSQKAHCQGKKKKQMSEEKLKGGVSDKKTLGDIAKKHRVKIDILKKQLNKGIKV